MANSSVSAGKPGRSKNGAGAPLGAAVSTAPKGPIAASTAPTYDDVARKAYEIYERDGRLPGRDLENWLQAEIELGLRPSSH
jgi:hypothetical protein